MEERILPLLENLNTKVDGLSAQISQLDQRVGQLESRFDQLDRRIDNLERNLIAEFHAVDADRADLTQRVENLELDMRVVKRAVAGPAPAQPEQRRGRYSHLVE